MRWSVYIHFLSRPSERERLRFLKDLSALYTPRYLSYGVIERPGFVQIVTPAEDFGSEPTAVQIAVEALAAARFGADVLRVSAHPSVASQVFHFEGSATLSGVTVVFPKRSQTLLIDNKDATNDLDVSFDAGENYQTVPAGGTLSVDAFVDSVVFRGAAVSFSGLLT